MIDGKIVTYEKTVPNIYAVIRAKAVVLGYTWNSGTNPLIIDDLINETFKEFNIKGHGENYYIWNWYNEIEAQINDNKPTIFNIGRGTYEKHTVVIKGYRIYERPKTILFFTVWEYLHFAEVSDHWVNYSRYFDYDQYAYDLVNNGIGSFSRIYFD